MIKNKIFQANAFTVVKQTGWWRELSPEAGRMVKKLLKLPKVGDTQGGLCLGMFGGDGEY